MNLNYSLTSFLKCKCPHIILAVGAHWSSVQAPRNLLIPKMHPKVMGISISFSLKLSSERQALDSTLWTWKHESLPLSKGPIQSVRSLFLLEQTAKLIGRCCHWTHLSSSKYCAGAAIRTTANSKGRTVCKGLSNGCLSNRAIVRVGVGCLFEFVLPHSSKFALKSHLI